jgi:hypothetical protein
MQDADDRCTCGVDSGAACATDRGALGFLWLATDVAATTGALMQRPGTAKGV